MYYLQLSIKFFHKRVMLSFLILGAAPDYLSIIVQQDGLISLQTCLQRMSLLLRDPKSTRINKNVPLPYQQSIMAQQLFINSLIDVKLLMQFFENEGVLHDQIVHRILRQSREILSMEPNVIQVSDPVTIVGDIHGQFYDLVKIIKLNTNAQSHQKYLFLGDYVDRGLFSIQTLLLILSMKINNPKKIIILRGNHESKQLTSHFNFRSQCLECYNQTIYDEFTHLFCFLPLAAVVNRKFLCLHGGISANMHSIQDIMKINRFVEVPETGLFCDLLWADPIDHTSGKLNGLTVFNDSRGCSYYFGYSLAKRILEANEINCIIRAHEAKQEGYEMHNWAGINKFPPVITVFSAPNYCDFYNNKGAILLIEKNIIKVQQIQKSSHPFYLPNSLTLFEWTIPFIAQKITQMFNFILKPESAFDDEVGIHLIDRYKVIEQLLKMQQEDAEDKMEAVLYQGKVLGQELMSIEQARDYVLRCEFKSFDVEKTIDKVNEKRPHIDELATSQNSFKEDNSGHSFHETRI